MEGVKPQRVQPSRAWRHR